MLEFFANPGYLAAGGALVSAPIIIHLINRMRFKRLRWAAMEFLLKSQKRNRRRLIIEQLLLLFLRCLLVALVTLLVARFAGFSFAQSQTKDTIYLVLLDDTLSMNDQWKEADGQKNCFLVVKAEVEKIIKSMSQTNRNDRLIVLPLSKVGTDRTYQPKTYSRLFDKAKMDEAKNDLGLMEASQLHVNLLPAIKKAQEIVLNNPESQIKLYLFSDLRQSDWSLPAGETQKDALLKLAKGEDVFPVLQDCVYPYRLKDQGGVPLSRDNVGIVDLRASTRVAGKGMPVTFTVTVANYSSRERQVTIPIYNDKKGVEYFEIDPIQLKIPADSTASASFDMRFYDEVKATESTFVQISAHLEAPQRGKLDNDGLAHDNVRYATVEIREKVPVLVIDGEGSKGRLENQDSFFLKNAIISVPGASYDVVYGDELGGGVPTKVLERSDLLQFPTIFLLNVRELTPKQLTNLENYVRDGGGVGFFLGSNVDPLYYNKNLYKKGKGIFPVPLRESGYFPPADRDPLKPEYTADEWHVLLRDVQFPTLEQYPIFGSLFRDGAKSKEVEVLKDLPIKRYFQVPRSEWRPQPGKVEELATLPNDRPVSEYTGAALEIFKKLDKILADNEEFQPNKRGLDRHRKTIESLVGPGSEKKAQHLATALTAMLQDKGKEKERADYPNLTEFWTNSDPKIRSLREDITSLADEAKYGDPFVIAGLYGKGKTVAVMTTAGKEWNDWGGGSGASLIYQPFVWEMQNYLSSQASDSYLTVGTPVQIAVDAEQYKKPGRQLKMVRTFKKAQHGKPAQDLQEGDQFPEQAKGELIFNFDKNLEPGLYVSQLMYEDGKKPLASWGHVFNVDTPREGKLQRISQEDLEKIRKDSGDKIKIESPQTSQDLDSDRVSDLSESPWFFLLFLGVLVAEQALAVHLSFHLKGGEAELPATVARVPAKAA